MRPCFSFRTKTEKKPAVLAIDDDIGFWGVQSKDFRNALDGIDGPLRVEINSPGGEVMAGLSMHNMLRTLSARGHEITTVVTGVAGSIASVVALAGDKRVMPENTFAMIHGISSGVFGTVDEVAEHAEMMAKVQKSLRNIYIDRMGVDEAKADALMAKDNWLTAQECLEMGFATELGDAVTATAHFDMARADLPENVRTVFAKASGAAPTVEPIVADASGAAPVEIATEGGGYATPLAEEILAKASGFGLGDYAATFALKCADMTTAIAAMNNAREIVALCSVVGKKDAAGAFIASGKTVLEARTALVEALAADDKQIDGSTPEPKETSQTTATVAKSKVVDSASIWASHDSQKQPKGR